MTTDGAAVWDLRTHIYVVKIVYSDHLDQNIAYIWSCTYLKLHSRIEIDTYTWVEISS
jgi:hypothetical protein